jgi:hypothetical protein
MENSNVGSDVKEVVVKEVEKDYSDIFVTEKDTFDVTIKYYKKDGKIYTDSGTDEVFSVDEKYKDLTVTLKYPDQADSVIISSSIPSAKNIDKIEMADFLSLELSRLIVLIRKWSIDKKITKEAILSLNPKIVKGLLFKIRDVLGMEGLF